MKFFSSIASSLVLVVSAAGTGRAAAADCSSYTNCVDCVQADCAYSDKVCYDSCDEVSAVNDCFALENYVGVDGPEALCTIAGAPPKVVPDIGGSATIGENEDDEDEDEDSDVQVEDEEDCPTPGDGVCTADYTPVICGSNNETKCEYPNACNAGLAGFDTDTDCVLVGGEEEMMDCPPMGEGMCTMEYEPVLCGENNCEYGNGCGAELAGFNPDEDCTLMEPAEPESGACPPMGEGMCTMEYMPVLCGENDCEYSNSCNAALAGFNSDEDCTPKEPAEPESAECPPVGDGMCTMEYMPIVCGDNNCEYDNGCNAELAGFNPDTDCVLLEDMMDHDEMGGGNMTLGENNVTGSACSMLPTCESCLNARLKACVWTAGMCEEQCLADTSCWSPSIQGGNMTSIELCAMAAEDDFPSDDADVDVDVVTSRQNINAAAVEDEASAAFVVVQEGILAAVASMVALLVVV